MFIDEEDDAIVVELYGQQFYWAARVSGEDNVLGKANVRYIEGVNILGVDVLILMRKMILLLKNCIFQRVRKYTLRCVLKMFFTRRTCLILELK
jgi:hypothetical protein